MTRLTLKSALKQKRLDEFIAQEEARGVSPVNEHELMDAIKHIVKQPKSKDQTSRSPSRDGSRGK